MTDDRCLATDEGRLKSEDGSWKTEVAVNFKKTNQRLNNSTTNVGSRESEVTENLKKTT